MNLRDIIMLLFFILLVMFIYNIQKNSLNIPPTEKII